MLTTPDYIIVGAGTSGCILAHKLSRRFSVLLIEAGPYYSEDPNINQPINYLTLTENANMYFYNLGSSVVTTKNGKPLLPFFFYPTTFSAVMGRLVGGGSSINGMKVVRGTKSYYDEMSKITNDRDWGYSNISRHFIEMENFHPACEFSRKAHGFHGCLDISQTVASPELASDFVNTMSKIHNVPCNIDYNDFYNEVGSFKYWQLTTDNEKRVTSASSFLEPLRKCKSMPHTYHRKCKKGIKITLLTMTTVKNVILDHKKRARGVEVIVDGCHKTFLAHKGVILCAGLNTSTLLQLSGIGDRASLDLLKINCRINSPHVGKHMKNHPMMVLLGVGKSYKIETPNDIYSGGVFLSDPSKYDCKRSFEILAVADPSGVVVVAGINLRAESEGYITIQSSDPLQPPLYDYKYYDKQSDIDSMLILYRYIYDSIIEMGMQPIGATGPAPNPHKDSTAVEKYILNYYAQAYHWTGMTRIGCDRYDGVIDSNCRVFGSQRLYVADCGIFPTNPVGNTQMPAYLAGSILADKLLKQK